MDRLCLGQELAKYEACLGKPLPSAFLIEAQPVAVLSTILKEFNINFASDYLKTVKMSEIEDVPRHSPSLTLPMVSCFASLDSYADDLRIAGATTCQGVGES